MALAIELAAGRYPSLGVDGLLAGLDHRLRILTGPAADDNRHRSLAGAIAWSYDLLAPRDRTVLDAISVFASWFDVRAAAAVTEIPGPRRRYRGRHGPAVRPSSARRRPGAADRYRMLETILSRDERLRRTGRAVAAHDRHRIWCYDRLTELAGEAHDDEWCGRFDRVADDVRAAILAAADGGNDASAGRLAEQLARQLLLRGNLAEAQRRYEQAAQHAAPGPERIRLLRLAAGTAAARVTGNDTLRLLDEAAAAAVASGDLDSAAECRAWMVIYRNMMPGIMADVPGPGESAQWLREARELTNGATAAEAAIGVATASGLPESEPDSTVQADRALIVAHLAGAPLIESVALDQLCSVALARGDLTYAIDTVHRRAEVLDALPLDASTAYQFNDYLLMAAEIHLAAGDLEEAGRYADRLAELPPIGNSGIWPIPVGSRSTRWPATSTGRPRRAIDFWPPGNGPGDRSPAR